MNTLGIFQRAVTFNSGYFSVRVNTINPALLAQATSADIDQAWEELLKEPRTFYANEDGTLASFFDEDWPTWRQSLFGLGNVPTTQAELIPYVQSVRRLEHYVANLFDEAAYEDKVGQASTWQEWIAAGDETFAEIREQLVEWLEDHADSTDWEYADLDGYTGRGDALEFFSQERETAKLFAIDLVYGAHPGSSYYAAELRMDVDAANALAEAKGLPIRFAFGDQA